MTDPSGAAPVCKGHSLKILAGSLAGAVFLYAATLAGGTYFLHRSLSPLFEAVLRKAVFTAPSRGTFTTAGLDLVRGRARLEGLSVPGAGGPPLLFVRSLEARFPLFSKGERRELSLSLDGARVSVNAAGDRPAALPPWAAPAFQEIPLREVDFTDGTLEFSWDPALPSLRLEGVDGSWRREDAGGWVLDLRARVPSDPPAEVAVKAAFNKEAGDLDVAIKGLPWAYLSERLSAPGEDLRFLSGQVSLKTSATLRDGFVTANPLVELKGLKLEVPVEKKKFAGFSVEKVRQVLDVDALSFTVPINGRWDDPRVSFAVTLEQVLDNALRQKIPDDADRARVARRGGSYLGAKADRAFKEWLARRRG